MKQKKVFSAVALVLISVIALSLSSCFRRSLQAAAGNSESAYTMARDYLLYDTIIIDGEIFRIVGTEENYYIKGKNTRAKNLILGDRVEYMIGDENGVPLDGTKTENDAHWLGDEKEYVMDSYALVWGKDGRESYNESGLPETDKG